MKVFLDDLRTTNMSHTLGKGLGLAYENDWVIVRDYFEFVDLVNNSFDEIDLVSFDHDLACFRDGEEFTGKTAVDYLINYCLDNNKKLPNWYAHTDNTSGRQNIIGSVLNYLKVIEKFDISGFRYYHKGIINGISHE